VALLIKASLVFVLSRPLSITSFGKKIGGVCGLPPKAVGNKSDVDVKAGSGIEAGSGIGARIDVVAGSYEALAPMQWRT
jgi:hypothetical protein